MRHAPSINARVEGSVQQMSAESVTLNGGAVITGDLLVPGVPTVKTNGNVDFGGVIVGTGNATPVNYTVTLNGKSQLGHLHTRTDAVSIPNVADPPAPAGTRKVNLNKSTDSPGDFSTLSDLTLNGNVGSVAVPPGSYGNFTANGNSTLVLGVADSRRLAVYSFQHLTINGNAGLTVVGPVVVTVKEDLTLNANAGAVDHPEWLSIKLSAGNFTLNGKTAFYGYVTAPAGTVTVNGNTTLVGGVTADKFTLNGSGLVHLIALLPSLPYTADFEPAQGYALGSLDGQFGWRVDNGTASVVNDAAFSGTQSVRVDPTAAKTQVTQTFSPPDGENVVFAELFAVSPTETDVSASPVFDFSGARCAFVRNGARADLYGFDGDGAGGGAWVKSRFSTDVGADGITTSWVRLTVRLDYSTKHWDLYANGVLVAIDQGFVDNTQPTFATIAVTGDAVTTTRIDYVFAATVNPLFTDADKDGMDDAWEIQNGLNPSLNDRNGDKDGDGLTNIQEYLYGTRADLADTDGDGLSDSWEIAHGTNPLDNDAIKDSDGDGISDAQEYLNGTDPFDYYNGTAPVLSYVSPALQIGRRGMLGPWPLALVAKDVAGNLLKNAPITFALGATDGRFLTSITDGPGVTELAIRTDANGIARVWFKLATGLAGQAGVTARAYIHTAIAREVTFQVTPAVESSELAAGLDDSLWIDQTGVGRAWGRNTAGQLGDGTVTSRSQMKRIAAIPSALGSAVLAATHALALTSGGDVYAWGDDYFGQLGDGLSTTRTTPALVAGLSGVQQVAAGDYHSVVLRGDGTVWTWGGNQWGQLGDGTRVNRATPVQVPGLTNIVRIAAGARYTVALGADGTVSVWGANDFGQAGAGDAALTSPTPIAGLTDVVVVAAGRQHVLALRVDGTVIAWGGNQAGQLGIGSVRGSVTPQPVSSLPTSVGIAAGNTDSFALGTDGVLRAWGGNVSGQLGTGSNVSALTPVALAATAIRALAVGGDHAVLLHTDGTLQAWGLNTYGQLGVAAGPPSNSPVTVAPPVD